jgi:hypothetical protein
MSDPALVPPLKPCNCGWTISKPRLSSVKGDLGHGHLGWSIECIGCNRCTGRIADKAEAMEAWNIIAAWNRRAAVTLDEASVEVVARALKFTHEFVTEELKVRVDSHTLGGDLKSVDDSEGALIGEAMDCLAKIDEARSAIAALKERT